MYVRWQLRSGGRLSARVVASRRLDGRVRQEHIGELASIQQGDGSIEARRAFWRLAEASFARLRNRIDTASEMAMRQALHDRVQMVTPDELRQLTLDQAERDTDFWSNDIELLVDTIADREKGIATQQRMLNGERQRLAESRAMLADAEARMARAKAGEQIQESSGLTKRQLYAHLRARGIDPIKMRRQVREQELAKKSGLGT